MVMAVDRRGDRDVFKAAYGALCVFALAFSFLDAAAADDPAAPLPKADVLVRTPGVVTMAPIPYTVAVVDRGTCL